ncbi:22260_t:CDS:2, partial [Dentiscutata erythropus]
SSKEDSETETEQENDFEDSSSIRNTGLLDDIELENTLVFNNDSNFPETLYKAKDAMLFKKTIIQFVVCEKCHFLTNLESIFNNSQASFSE